MTRPANSPPAPGGVTGPNTPTPPGGGDGPIGRYLAEVAARLPGPAGMRRDILAELDAGLRDAAEAHRAAGLETGQAARAAVAEFGSPEQVASGFRGELRTAQARRTALALLATGPLVGAAWAGTALASHIGAHLTAPWQWDGMTAGARLATHLGLVVLLTAIASALFTVATTGRLTRWVRARPPASAALAASGTAAMDLTLLTLLVTQAATAPGRLAALPAVLAAAASLTRLVLAGRAARRCLAPVAYPA